MALAAQAGSEIPGQLPDFSPVMQGVFGIEIPFHLPKEQNAEALALDKRYGDTEGLRIDIRGKANTLSVLEQLIEQVHKDREQD